MSAVLRPLGIVASAAVVGATGLAAPTLEAQETAYPPPLTIDAVRPLAYERELAKRSAEIVDALLEGVAATSEELAIEAYDRAVGHARALVEMAPAEPNAHYLLAGALGYRLEHSGIREKVRLGGETRRQAEIALELDPDHPGGHHVMGRLHAATMRLSSFARFLARRLLGAELMDGASWEGAEMHLTRARELEPTNPRHAAELGQLYLDTGRREAAIAEWRRAILEGLALDLTDRLAVERSREELAELGCSETTCPP